MDDFYKINWGWIGGKSYAGESNGTTRKIVQRGGDFGPSDPIRFDVVTRRVKGSRVEQYTESFTNRGEAENWIKFC